MNSIVRKVYQRHREISHGKEEMGNYTQNIQFVCIESTSNEPSKDNTVAKDMQVLY